MKNELRSTKAGNSIRRLEEALGKLGPVLRFRESNVHAVSLSSFVGETPDSIRFRCPTHPYYRDARIGVRPMPSNPDKTEKIFWYNTVITTSIEHQLGIELPVGCITITGNAEEGNTFIRVQEQIISFHCLTHKIHLLDAKYDEIDNYAFIRKQGALPLIDYNGRNENLASDALLERSHDRNGWPFVSYCRFHGHCHPRTLPKLLSSLRTTRLLHTHPDCRPSPPPSHVFLRWNVLAN